jgi:ATPase subunit of ABC transporter with duplicated ATPase domains
LPQTPTFATGATIRTAVLEAIAQAAADEAHEAEARVDELLAKLGLTEEPEGAEAPVARLSGGWRKRVALARALVVPSRVAAERSGRIVSL